MTKVTANGISIETETYGDAANPAILLVMGLGAQLTLWPIELVDALVARGFFVIRYDNRDIGLSQKFDDAGVPDMTAVIGALMGGQKPAIAYTLNDMAADGVGVLDVRATGETHFWSRSRREMWHKGRTSGHTQRIVAMRLDCDRDAVLVEVTPHGPACHTGAVSCFFTPVSLNIP